MARTKGSINTKTMQKYLHDRYPDQGWDKETDKSEIRKHYHAVKAMDEMVEYNQKSGQYE